MRVPLSWLREFVPITLAPEELAERLTVAGIEVEAIEAVGGVSPRVVAGEIVSAETLDGGRYHRVTIRVGDDRTVPIVTGDASIAASRPGTLLATALPGAILFGTAGDPLLHVKRTQLGGADSEGKLCSRFELGLDEEQDQPVTLPAGTPVGSPVAEALPEDVGFKGDHVLEIAILPNIARCQSILGVAREVAAITGTDCDPDLELATDLDAAPEAHVPIIDEPEACHRFGLAALDGVRVAPSPLWLRQRLALCGVGPINNVVDASNYAMLELGEPSHTYDRAVVGDEPLRVRFARRGETLQTLEQAEGEKPHALTHEILVIDSGGEAVAVAGVVGGKGSAISEGTTKVFLEAANFDFLIVRRAQRILGTHTDASARFSRGVDPALVPQAMARLVHLLRQTCPELTVVSMGHVSDDSEHRDEVVGTTINRVNAALGTNFRPDEAVAALRAAGIRCDVDESSGAIDAHLSSARPDLGLEADLYEEIARLIGYDRMPETVPLGTVTPHFGHGRLRELHRDLRRTLTALGLDQAICYSLTSADHEAKLLAADGGSDANGEHMIVQNPQSQDRDALRTTLVPQLLEITARRARATGAAWLFEIGPVFLPSEANEGLPDEPPRLGIVMAGPRDAPSWHERKVRGADFFDMKGAVEAVASLFHPAEFSFEATSDPMLQPGQGARVLHEGRAIGSLGKLHPTVAQAFDIKNHDAFVAELDLATLASLPRPPLSVREPSRHPSIELDISMLVDRAVAARDLIEGSREAAGELLESVSVLDVYDGEIDGTDRRSVTLRVELNARTRSLRTEESMEVRKRITNHLSERFGVEARE